MWRAVHVLEVPLCWSRVAPWRRDPRVESRLRQVSMFLVYVKVLYLRLCICTCFSDGLRTLWRYPLSGLWFTVYDGWMLSVPGAVPPTLNAAVSIDLVGLTLRSVKRDIDPLKISRTPVSNIIHWFWFRPHVTGFQMHILPPCWCLPFQEILMLQY